ncbi:hypothetical protein BU14_0023s0066 [Porphyra umbilicalis]|uniref:THIF-type NAD/FAD binding fold domain-containing protein n=1 Tax=Porphyra umbilicalis TaxID=2786 RepID=A0A1X6PK56_PORUM|nr:hypothetical protein BU14_0023s0066 [Porphyra umbilicalis]|eukprot:OSX81262.1 hypothetical protein BU14_0023s0066 [Porphyra umbilicalis]
METTSAKPGGPTDRYDRQIRLWGEAGQRRLEAASVCVVTASATGTETLKNLVLPGVGAFTLVDGGTVSVRDYGANFFLTPDAAAVGTPRATAAVAALGELNEAAAGTALSDDLSTLLTADGEGPDADGAAAAAFVSAYTVVVATQMGEGHPALRRLARACWVTGVPLVVARSFGLYGTVRVVASPEATVLNARDGSADGGADLRLTAPWPALSALAAATDLDALDDAAHAHVPAVVLLLKALASWAAAHGGGIPSSMAERGAFKKRLAGLRRPSLRDEDNFDEAARAANIRAAADGAAGAPSPAVAAVLGHPRADPGRTERGGPAGGARAPAAAAAAAASTRRQRPPSADAAALHGGWASGADAAAADASSFWLHAAALRSFVETAGGGRLPVAGALPDMTSDTGSYVALQTVYAERAAADAAAVAAAAAELAPRRPVAATRRRSPSSRGRSVDAGYEGAGGGEGGGGGGGGGSGGSGGDTTPPVLAAWDEASVKDFCRHAAAVRVIRYRSLDDEWGPAARGGADGAASPTDGGAPTAAAVEGGLPPAAYTSAGYTGTVGGVFAANGGGGDGCGRDGGGGGDGGVGGDGAALPSGLPAHYEANAGDGGAPSAASLYVALRAADRFYGHHGRYPGETIYGEPDGVDVDGDAALVRDLAAGVRAEVGLPPAASDDGDVVEVVRAAAAELHPVAALVGGLAAQEVMKLVTKQFVPVNNTVVVNLVAGTTESFEA